MSHCNALSRLTLGVAATTATTATSASGAIVVFDIPDTTLDTSQNNSPLYFTAINLQAATLTIGIDGPRGFPGFGFAVGTYFQFGGYLSASTDEFFSAGNTIDSNLSFFGNTFPYSSEVPNGIVYLGLALAQNEAFSEFNYGWFEINSTDNPLNGAHVFTFTRFAFNDITGQSILAGQTTAIPEASTLGLVGGLFSLAAAAHIRRRKLKQAAASDKFLALAAGEKLN